MTACWLIWSSLRQKAVGEAQFVLGEPLHADQETALGTVAARPLLDQGVDRFPAAQIEVADAEIGALGDFERVPQGWQKIGGDVVEDAGHVGVSF